MSRAGPGAPIRRTAPAPGMQWSTFVAQWAQCGSLAHESRRRIVLLLAHAGELNSGYLAAGTMRVGDVEAFGEGT